MKDKIRITLKPFNDGISDARYTIAQITNAIRVSSGSKEHRVGDTVTEAEAEKLVENIRHEVCVRA